MIKKQQNQMLDNETGVDISWYLEEKLGQLKQEKEAKKDEVCSKCGGTGRTKENPYKCDVCGKEYKGEDSRPNINFIKDVYIPDKYRNKVFDIPTILKNINDTYERYSKGNTFMAESFLKNLKNILEVAEKAQKWEYSVIVCTPNGCGEREFMYTFLSIMSARGYSVSPITNISNITLEDKTCRLKYMEKDILALSITSYKLIENMEKLEQILDQRDLEGKATLVITNVAPNTLFTALKTKPRVDHFIVYKPDGIDFN